MKPQVVTTLGWRHIVLLLFIFGSLVYVFMNHGPIPQDPGYHDFVDTRSLMDMLKSLDVVSNPPFLLIDIPNFLNVFSNLPFLLVGILGLGFLIFFHRPIGPAKKAWSSFFIGVSMVGVGSAYYHWRPEDGTLFWDRLTMTILFMSLFVALLGEYVSHRLGSAIFWPALLVGVLAVAYWPWTGDLRLYLWVQYMPLVVLIMLFFLFKSSYSHQSVLLAALGLYLYALMADVGDYCIFEATSKNISGHTIKHLLAAAACSAVIVFLARRQPPV